MQEEWRSSKDTSERQSGFVMRKRNARRTPYQSHEMQGNKPKGKFGPPQAEDIEVVAIEA